MPCLGETRKINARERVICGNFFLGGYQKSSNWYVAEFDGRDLFFGFVILRGDYERAGWKIFSHANLKTLSLKRPGGSALKIMWNKGWIRRPAKEVFQIVRACPWMID